MVPHFLFGPPSKSNGSWYMNGIQEKDIGKQSLEFRALNFQISGVFFDFFALGLFINYVTHSGEGRGVAVASQFVTEGGWQSCYVTQICI